MDPGDQGKSSQQCHNLTNLVVGQQFLVPVFDDTVPNGNNSRFHLINLAWFTITHSEVDCNGDHLRYRDASYRNIPPARPATTVT